MRRRPAQVELRGYEVATTGAAEEGEQEQVREEIVARRWVHGAVRERG